MIQSLTVLDETFSRFSNVGLHWNTGNPSTLCLYLVKKVLRKDIPIIFVDTLNHFEETYHFLKHLKEQWGLTLHVAKPKDNNVKEMIDDQDRCCQYHKTIPLLETVDKLGLDAVIVSTKWDDPPSRRNEASFREKQGPVWVHTLRHLSRQKVLVLCRTFNIPRNPLYEKGYPWIECKPCTHPHPEKNDERAERSEGKERVLKHLKDLGYF